LDFFQYLTIYKLRLSFSTLNKEKRLKITRDGHCLKNANCMFSIHKNKKKTCTKNLFQLSADCYGCQVVNIFWAIFLHKTLFWEKKLTRFLEWFIFASIKFHDCVTQRNVSDIKNDPTPPPLKQIRDCLSR
jgi:hypothetical protein